MPVSDLRILHGSIQTWTLLGQVPFLLFIALIYLASRKNGWDQRRTVLATGAFVAGLSAGTSLLPSVLGAMVGGITTWIVAQRILGLRQAPLIAMGLGLMGLVAIGRFGCLLSRP